MGFAIALTGLASFGTAPQPLQPVHLASASEPSRTNHTRVSLTLDGEGGKRFLLITTQRSGSTWLSQILRSQHGIELGLPNDNAPEGVTSEMMIQYTTKRCCTTPSPAESICAQPSRGSDCVLAFNTSRPARSVPFDEWVGEAERVLALVAHEYPAAAAHGFKLMYNQIPIWQRPQFGEWIRRERIAVIHLVREATLETAASEIAAQSASDGGTMHTHDGAVAEQTMDDQPVRLELSQWTQLVTEAESMTGWWDRFLSDTASSHGGYHRLTYESLIGAGRDDAISAALRFLNREWTPERWPIQTPKAELLEMHPSGCTDRIFDYQKVRRAIAGTRTAKACDALAASQRGALRAAESPHDL
jgi:LPS sulfotransferase NodH